MQIDPTLIDKQLVLGNGDNTQISPMKYQWAWEWFIDSMANHWTPGEIQMGKDIHTYEHVLTPNEKHIFTNTLAYLTTSDVLAMRNVSIAIAEKITAPEVQHALIRHAAEETVHVWTYQHCLQCLKLDEKDIYTRYLRTPEINGKFQLSNKYLKDLLETRTLENKDDVENFLYGYIFFSLIFEGVWFYNDFSPIFSMKRRNRMSSTAEQLEYIFRDEVHHVKLGTHVIRGIIEEQGIKLDLNLIKRMFDEALAVEETYIKYILGTGMIGYSVDQHMQQSRVVSNRRLAMLKLPSIYPDKEPAFKWLDEITGGLRKEKNFFETRVTEYQSGAGLDFGDKTDWKPNW